MPDIDLYSPIPGPLAYRAASPRTLHDQNAIATRPSDWIDEEWVAPYFKIVGTDERGKELLPARVLALPGGYLAFSSTNIPMVRNVLAEYGDFLPVDTTMGEYLYLRPSHYLGGLDAEESGVKYSADGSRIIWFRNIVIRNRDVDSVGVFKVEELHKSPVLYRPDIVSKLLDSGSFEGVEFKKKGIAVEQISG